MGHDERSGREPDIRPACPVAQLPDGWGQGRSEPKQPKQPGYIGILNVYTLAGARGPAATFWLFLGLTSLGIALGSKEQSVQKRSKAVTMTFFHFFS